MHFDVVFHIKIDFKNFKRFPIISSFSNKTGTNYKELLNELLQTT